MTAFKVGDQVTIHNSQTGPEKAAVVEAFTEGNRCMVLSDGSKWRADGQRQWRVGSGYYKGPVVERTRPGDLDIVTRRRAIGVIRKFAQDLNMDSPLDAAALKRIVDRIQEEQAAAPKDDGAA
ncbi:hypothetical protein [Azospirillum isscasi]|uniref:Uncharacterized protein n=1 Tax=Azospirillum isscasi TaxID=3053926 RepID=A0ABU0WM90_9PROT|nr:hypothetical protein [Azospirillum isscasi]MDQ2105296.1 hypothetical protein [Azospirillum isscasi]